MTGSGDGDAEHDGEDRASEGVRRALAHRQLADLEARRRTRGGTTKEELEAVGFSPRQAAAIVGRHPLFLRAFLTECDRVFGATACPHTMPDWLRLELTILYRKGGFTDAQTAAIVANSADVWRCSARDLGLRDTSPARADLTPPGDEEGTAINDRREAEEATEPSPPGEPDPILNEAFRRYRRGIVASATILFLTCIRFGSVVGQVLKKLFG